MRKAWAQLAQFFNLCSCLLQIALTQQQRDDCRPRSDEVRLDGYCLRVRRLGALPILPEVPQQLALQIPSIRIRGVRRNNFIGKPESFIDLLGLCKQPCLENQGGRVIGLRQQRLLSVGGGLLWISLGCIRSSQSGLDLGHCLLVGEIGVGILIRHLLELLRRKQSFEQWWHRLHRGVPQIDGSLQFGCSRCLLAGLQQRLSKEKACFRDIRLELKRALEMKDSRLAVVLLKTYFGQSQQFFAALAAGGEQQRGGAQGKGCRGLG